MKLSEIYQHSKGLLTHAERDFYLAFCAYADNDSGFCYPRMATVAEVVGASRSSASRMFAKLENLGFIRKEKGGFRCLLGYHSDNKSYHYGNKSYQGDNSLLEDSYQGDNKSSHSDNSSYQGDNSHIKEGTIHLTKEESVPADCREVFEHWQEIHGKKKSALDNKRLSKIKARLRSFTVEVLKQAILGATFDDWLMGREKNSIRKFDGIETIFRDDAQVERLVELYQNKTAQPEAPVFFNPATFQIKSYRPTFGGGN